jgi:MoaA/NifB/PqqE/SkfB family radical SAM enzyme
MKEWNNPYNSFNSMKVLLWREQLQAIADQDFMPPVIVDTDPSNRCNYNCIWCNAYEYMEGSKFDISPDHLRRLADFYAEWGVKASCVAGGGEPLMNKGLLQFLLDLKERNIEIGVITNGFLLDSEYADVMAKTCRWVGVSVDAGTAETYNCVKGIKLETAFDRVMGNIAVLAAKTRMTNSSCDVCFKYLLHPINALELYEAAKLAKGLGVRDFQMRPVGWDNIRKTEGKGIDDFTPLLEKIDEQVEMALELEDEDFHFYGVRHKFRPDMKRKVGFKRCWALPLLLTFGADGNCHLCFDRRGDKNLIFCRHDPDPREVLKHWNTERHKKMLADIDVRKCPRCTFGPYNEVVENVFLRDGMCRNFP